MIGRVAQHGYDVRHLVEHGCGDAGQASQAVRRGNRDQAREQLGEDLQGKGIGHGGQRPRRVEPSQQHRTGGRVVIEQADRAVAIPGTQTDGFAGILFVERLELQSGGRAVRADHWQHERCHAVPGWTVWPQRPAVQDVRD